jgi:hypothetical protein
MLKDILLKIIVLKLLIFIYIPRSVEIIGRRYCIDFP